MTQPSSIGRLYARMRADVREEAKASIATWLPRPTKKYGNNILHALKGMIDAGMKRAEIAAEFGITRNAVIGLSWRQGLCKPKPVVARREPPAWTDSVGNGCMWGIGDVGDPDFHFCGAPQAAGSAYCQEHKARTVERVLRPLTNVGVPTQGGTPRGLIARGFDS